MTPRLPRKKKKDMLFKSIGFLPLYIRDMPMGVSIIAGSKDYEKYPLIFSHQYVGYNGQVRITESLWHKDVYDIQSISPSPNAFISDFKIFTGNAEAIIDWFSDFIIEKYLNK